MRLPTTLLAAVTALGFATAPALAYDPTGIWATATGESHYAVTFCGDGTQLCIELVWLREEVRAPETLALMNTRVVDGAIQTAPVKWKGNLTIADMSVYSTITLTSLTTIEITGCILIACNTIHLNKVES